MLSAKDSSALQNLFKMQSEMPSSEFDQLLGLKHSPKKRSVPFKFPSDDGKVFSNYFTNVIVEDDEKRLIKPMRYRVRPNGSKKEVPTKYNVFNARIDSLEIRGTWAPLFMRNHGIVPLTGFYEWVSKDGRIQFKSFAIITDGPPPEIEKMGHDRCPIFLEKEQIDLWLNPVGKSRSEIYDSLTRRENVSFGFEWGSA